MSGYQPAHRPDPSGVGRVPKDLHARNTPPMFGTRHQCLNVHPVRTERWRPVTLPMALAWTFFAGWSAWVNFHPESWAHWGLVITSIYLICAGAAQQLIPLAED